MMSTPTPDHAGLKLERLTVRKVSETQPAWLREFVIARDALWVEYHRLLALATNDRLGACRLKLLERFFGTDEVNIDDCWSAIRVIRGDAVLNDFNEAVTWLINSGCTKPVD